MIWLMYETCAEYDLAWHISRILKPNYQWFSKIDEVENVYPLLDHLLIL